MYIIYAAMLALAVAALSTIGGPLGPIPQETYREADAEAIAENILRAHHFAIQYILENRSYQGEIPMGSNEGATIYRPIQPWPSIRDADGRVITYITPTTWEAAGLNKAKMQTVMRHILANSRFSRTIGTYKDGEIISDAHKISPPIPIRADPAFVNGTVIVSTRINE